MKNKPQYIVKSRIWIESEAGTFIGEGRINLLKNIDVTGSLSKAAQKMNMSYKKAWKMVNSMNKYYKEPLVSCSVGGIKGGGSVLTESGKRMIKLYTLLNEKNHIFLKNEMEKIEL